MDFGLYIGIRYVGGKIGSKDLNNRSNTLKTLSTYSTIVGRLKIRSLKG